MSIYSVAESGTGFHRSRFTKSISFTKRYDCQFGQMVPVLAKLALPGDVWRIGGQVLVRFQPQVAPSLTTSNFRVRYFFVPLRLLDPNTELIITGSKDGHLFSGNLPKFPSFVDNADKVSQPACYRVPKHGFYDYLGCQVGDYEAIKNAKFLPAEYYGKGYERIYFDYYDDENVGSIHLNYSGDFESFWSAACKRGANQKLRYCKLPKDYFTSSLPWQLKGVAPTVPIIGTGTFTPNFNISTQWIDEKDSPTTPLYDGTMNGSTYPFVSDPSSYVDPGFSERFNECLEDSLNGQTQNINMTVAGFNADELRTMMAQTRIFERLARTGSRYTEYLRANFGTAPADDTLQRSQYLGGWKLPIITTEVLQTAEDGSTPVGTMRGHGITNGGNRINTFFCKEFGLIFGIAHILPNIEYTTGCPKEFAAKERFDFFNPSFQHLSEQEVKNGELYVNFSGTDNDDTFGYQAYGNELRSSVDLTVGDLRDSLSYWTQSIKFNSRPNLNNAFISSESYLSNFNQNFAVSGDDAYPCIVQFRNELDVYRPMVRYSTPGLVDHL